MSTPAPPTPVDETDRLAAVQATGLLDTPPEDAFDDLVALASEIMGTPIALITLVDADRQWFKAKLGIDVAETPRADAFCGWAIAQPEELFVVDDATADERFSANPLVTGETGIRFYAGAVVRDAGGHPLGTICGIDRTPRELRPEQAAQLRILARQVGRLVELRQLSDRLARSEAQAQAIADRSSDIVVVLDGAGTIVYVNETMTDILGWQTAERVGTNAFDLIHPDDLVVVSGEFSRLLADPGAVIPPLVIRVARADGGRIAAEILATNLLDHPDVGGIVANLRDVTYRQEAEARVERSQRRLAVAQRMARMGSWELDVATHTHHWSPGLFELCGLDPEAEPSDEAWTSTMRSEDRPWIAAAVVEAVEKDVPFSFRRRLVRTDGTERWVFVQGEVELDERGEPVWIRGTLIDIDDEVAAEEALTSERRFLATVLDTMEDSIVACDADGRLLLFNPAARRLHGLTADADLPPEEWSGHYDLFRADGTTPLATDEVPLLRALTTGSVTNEEIVVRREGGTPRLMCCNGQSIGTVDEVQLGPARRRRGDA